MVSAVFQSPLEAAAEATAAARAATPSAIQPVAVAAAAPVAVKPVREPFDWRELWMRVLPPVAG